MEKNVNRKIGKKLMVVAEIVHACALPVKLSFVPQRFYLIPG